VAAARRPGRAPARTPTGRGDLVRVAFYCSCARRPAQLSTDLPEIGHHSRTISKESNAARITVTPRNRHLDQVETVATRQREKLDIEHPALDFESPKEREPGDAGEDLESALRVLESGQDECSNDQVEGPPEEIAPNRLADPA
jgi:hypothetical protein